MSEPSKLLGLPRSFLAVLSGQLLSLLGTQLTGFCLGVVILKETGSVTQFSLFSAAVLMPAFLLAPLVGPLADRYPKKRLLIISHALSGMASLALAWLFWSGNFSFSVGIVLVGLSSAASAIQFPAFNAAIAVLVEKDDLGRASGLAQFGYGVAQLIGPPLGGLLLPLIQISGVIFCDVLSFSSAIILLSLTTIPDGSTPKSAAQPSSSNTYLSDLSFAFGFMLKRPGLFSNLVLQGIMNLAIGISVVAITPLVLSVATERELGLILSVGGLGILIGGFLMTVTKAPKSLIRTIGLAMTLQAVAFTSMGLTPTLPVLMTASILGGFTLPVIYTSSDLLWQHKVQPSIQGKVFGVRPLIAALPYPLGFLTCGPLVDDILKPAIANANPESFLLKLLPAVDAPEAAAALGISGIALLVFLIVLHSFDSIRNVETRLTDHVSLFGQVLIQLKFASEEDIDDALWWQQAHRRTTGTKAPLGQILIARSVISPAELAMAEKTLGQRQQPDTVPQPTSHAGLATFFEGVSPTDLPDSSFDERGLALLGPILVELGFCEIGDLMRMYQYQHFKAASGEKRYLGELMMAEKLINARQLEKALALLHERRKGLS